MPNPAPLPDPAAVTPRRARPLSSLTRQERAWCARRVCFLCEQRLSTDDCGGIFERCTQEMMDQRRGNALATYRPRSNRTGG